MTTSQVLTLIDLAKRSGNDVAVGLIDETTKATPEISGMTFDMAGNLKRIPNVGWSRPIKGTQYKVRVRTGLPPFQFRSANAGVAFGKSSYEQRLVECFMADMKFGADKGLADVAEDGPEAMLNEEGEAQVLSAMIGLSRQFYYGRGSGGDALGHPGLIDSIDTTMETDATGTTGGAKTSVWFVKFGPQFVQWVFGNNGGLKPEALRIGDMPDPNDATKTITAYIQELMLWAGVQCKHRYACSRIKNITVESGKGLTDALINKNISLWPAGIRPDVCFALPAAIEQLRESRTATNATGTPAPFPDTVGPGIPLAPTDALLFTEA